MRINFPEQKLNETLQNYYGDSLSIDSLSEIQRKELVVDYVKRKIQITINDSVEVNIGAGGIRLGDHVSDLILVLDGYVPDWSSLECRIGFFEESETQTNLFKMATVVGTIKALLTKENDFHYHAHSPTG